MICGEIIQRPKEQKDNERIVLRPGGIRRLAGGLSLGVVVAELLDKLLELGGHFGQLFSGHLGGSCS